MSELAKGSEKDYRETDSPCLSRYIGMLIR